MPTLTERAAETAARFEEAWDQYTEPGQTDTFLIRASEKLSRRSGASADADTPMGKVLASVYGELSEVALAANEGVERSLRQEALAEEIACCVLEGVYNMLSTANPDWARTAGEWRRQVEYGKAVALLRAIRASLSAALVGSRRGHAGWSVGILGFGLSGVIRRGMHAVLLGPTMVLMSESERVVQRIGDGASSWLGTTRCEPILHLWNALMQHLYGETGGFFRKGRGQLLSIFSEIEQSINAADRSFGESVEESSFGSLGYEAVRRIIDAIDLILGSIDVLRRCRVRMRVTPEQRSARRGQDGRRSRLPRDPRDLRPPSGPDDPRRREGPEAGREDEPGPRRRRTREEEEGPGTDEPQLPEGFAPEEDELIGQMAVGPQSEQSLFLTRANISLVARDLGASREAQAQALEGNCRDRLQDDTIEALRQAGVVV